MRKSKLEPSQSYLDGWQEQGGGTLGASLQPGGGIQAGAEELISSFQMLLPPNPCLIQKAGIGEDLRGRAA